MLGKSNAPYYQESDDMMAKFNQEIEDDKIKRAICKEAYERVDMWMDGKLGIVIFNPIAFSYTIYHEPTAKYLHADFAKLINEKYLEFANLNFK